MKDVIEKVEEWRARGDRVVLATVISVKRSAPRPPGAKMAVNDRGDVHGAVSGGCVEGAVVEAAEEVLRGGEPRLLHFGIADSEAWDVGLPCGGEIDVFVEPYTAGGGPSAHPAGERVTGGSPHEAFARAAREGGRAALVTLVGREDGSATVGGRLLVSADGAVVGTLGDLDLDRRAVAHAEELVWAERSEAREADGVTLFVDVVHPRPRLIVFGAVDFATELCRMARTAGWLPYLIDPRSRFATPERFPDAEEVIVGWPGEALVRLGGIDRATYIAILTHDPKLDDAALTIALASEAPYVGAMGSRRAQARRRERLLAGGISEEALDRIAAPIGLDLGGLTAEETALSIMAEVVAVRNGREGGRLTHAAGRIHEVGA